MHIKTLSLISKHLWNVKEMISGEEWGRLDPLARSGNTHSHTQVHTHTLTHLITPTHTHTQTQNQPWGVSERRTKRMNTHTHTFHWYTQTHTGPRCYYGVCLCVSEAKQSRKMWKIDQNKQCVCRFSGVKNKQKDIANK